MTFGEYIETTRRDTGLSLRKTAVLLGITPSYLSDLEHNRRKPSRDLCRRMAQQYGDNFNELMDRACVLNEQAERDLENPEFVRAVNYLARFNCWHGLGRGADVD